MEALLRDITGKASEITVHSDDHPAYPVAMKRLRVIVTHRVTPGKDHRGVHNPLFPVNLLDLLIRHSQAGHKRETIAFAKRRAASAERLAVFLVWRNYMKGRREKKRGSPTPAMCRGMAEKPVRPGELAPEVKYAQRAPVGLDEQLPLCYNRTLSPFILLYPF